MSQLLAYLLLLLYLPVAIPSSTSVTVSPTASPSASVGNTPTSVARTSALSSTPTTDVQPSSSQYFAGSSSSVDITHSQLTPVQTSTVSTTKSSSITTHRPSTTAGPAGKGKTIGVLEIVGFCLAGVIVILVSLFGIYYFFFREKWYPEYWNKLEPETPAKGPEGEGKIVVVTDAGAGTKDNKLPETGKTHHGFVGDSLEVKVPSVCYGGPVEARNGVAAGGKQEVQSANNAGFCEDSAL